ncbi:MULTISPECIES: SMC-Scp complex subunit ScpB [Bombella]|uniref:SMC-Scp complex subunit ScpB n=1 Tax=Bombella pollinis TaxID=2967337 RepID=A0ABT3WLW2_9PROT|nr:MULTISPECIES: SMC-Scp complex subunit ScpB [Bombella]MCT6855888.1 SMC-Scp complex subunit ScpB [Bombella apis]MCX5619668.1 SMC-Scp complex subunit ScpB [Bombella pollinis]MUG04375.1 SMC-Scp complex subunit ScpB [Bombella sp. ESL0378]
MSEREMPSTMLEIPPDMVEHDRAAMAVSFVEALLFANAGPVSASAIVAILREQGLEEQADNPGAVLDGLAQRYKGHAVELQAVSGGWQLRTRAMFGPALARVIERPRRLSQGTLEALAIVAYHQPCTRVEIETIRGVRLGQSILDTLLEEGLITPKGRKEVPGRPVLWGTTPQFLRIFGLASLNDLPRREELLFEPPSDEGGSELEETIRPS